ncbi:MAG TPA: triose-phosphate isomerase [Friedmanniella sp.]
MSTGLPLWLGTSWKMTKTLAESRTYVHDLARTPLPAGVEVFLLPPVTALHAVIAALPAGSAVHVGVQNAHWAPDGPVTGEVSMRQVRDAGAEIVEIGHSDRRSQFGETDQVVAAKVTAALDQRLVPLVCVGEPWSVRAAGRAAEHVADQLRTALSGVAPADLSRVLVAYEPVWAIGDSGRAATPDHVVDVLARIRSVVADLASGARLRGLLYGGSVTTDNAADLLRLDDLDGLFVGRAAWTADGFAALLAVCATTAAQRLSLLTLEQRSQ